MGPCALRLVQRQVKHVWTKKAKHVWNSSPDSGGPMKLNIILRQERRGASHSESFYLSDPLYSLCLFVCLVAQMVKNLPAMQETWVWSLDREDSLQRGRATHSCSLAWRIPWTEAAAGPVHGVARVRHDSVTNNTVSRLLTTTHQAKGLPRSTLIQSSWSFHMRAALCWQRDDDFLKNH